MPGEPPPGREPVSPTASSSAAAVAPPAPAAARANPATDPIGTPTGANRGRLCSTLHWQAGPSRQCCAWPRRSCPRPEAIRREPDAIRTADGATPAVERRPRTAGGHGSGSEPKPDPTAQIGIAPIDAIAAAAIVPQDSGRVARRLSQPGPTTRPGKRRRTPPRIPTLQGLVPSMTL